MNNLKKIIKIMLISMILLFFLTIVAAGIIAFTSFKQSWADEALICVLSITAILFSFLTAAVLERKGLIVGFCASAVLLLMFYTSIFIAFPSEENAIHFSPYMVIPILFGMVGGVTGANNNK